MILTRARAQQRRSSLGSHLLAFAFAISSLTAFSVSATENDGEYVVVRDPLTRSCRVSEAKSDLARSNRIDDRISYPTRRDAEIGLSVMKPCMLHFQHTDSGTASQRP